MGGVAIEIIKIGTVSFVCAKALKCFGKKDYSDVISMCGWLGVGTQLYMLFIQMYSAFIGSEIVQLFQKIFG